MNKYQELFREDNQAIEERYVLSMDRIEEIAELNTAAFATLTGEADSIKEYFKKTAAFIMMIRQLAEDISQGVTEEESLEQLQQRNHRLYEDIIGSSYESSYANPAYANEKLGGDYGPLLCFLYTEIRGMIVFAYESRLTDITILNELFVEVYNLFEEELPQVKTVKDAIYWFVSDYCDVTVAYRIRESVDPSLSFAADIIMNSDLNDLRYLYAFGEYISGEELKLASFMNSLPEETIRKMADTYTEGYRIGFAVTGKDLSKKKTVVIRYSLGFERMIRQAVQNFKAMGLEPIFTRAAVNSVNKNARGKGGYFGASPNKQYDYDHRFDNALYLDRAFKERKLSVLRVAYEEYKELARQQAGPAVVETFGEELFEPAAKDDCLSLNPKQQKIAVEYASESGQIVNEYIPGEERSFTIIAFPVPAIGAEFEAIFQDTIRINTLDYMLYRDMQQIIIDALDQADHVLVKGKGDNKTELCIQLHTLTDPAAQTNFENCVADVNIPVGEVFTSPVLAGTNGTLHVSSVYIGDIQFKDLTVRLEDGMVADYSCSNFEDPKENKKLIEQVIMGNHQCVPIGEFAIGTNTTAYAMANQYGILHKLPILIVEKMGPHFALGDTCYSWAEDQKVYNPDGKEIIARDNEKSILRKEDLSQAYFNCHTDITIPYDELDSILAIRADKSSITIIEDGKFALPGVEELNKPLT